MRKSTTRTGSAICRAALVLGLALAALPALAGTAGAVTTIGSPLVRTPEKANCGEATFFNSEVAPPAVVKAPYDGVVVRWRLDLFEPGGTFKYKLRIIKPPAKAGGKYKLIASGPAQSAPAAGVNVLTLPQPIPIKAGDIIGYDCPQNAPGAEATVSPPDGTKFAFFGSIPADGESLTAANELTNLEVLFNADIIGVPSVTGVSPAAGGIRGGSTVTISGDHLADLTSASLGGAGATKVTPLSESEAKMTVPAHAAGKVDVQVTNAAGVSATGAGSGFEYLGPPTISAYAQSQARWRLGKKRATISRSTRRSPLGTAFSFTLNEAAIAKLTFSENLPGRKVKGKCAAATKGNATKPACTRTLSKGSLPISAHAGANKVAFQGRLSGSRKLGPGSYRSTVEATNAVGESSTSKPLAFKIVG